MLCGSVDHLCQLASKPVHSLSKYRVHKFHIRRTNGQRQVENTCDASACQSVSPGGRIKSWTCDLKISLFSITSCHCVQRRCLVTHDDVCDRKRSVKRRLWVGRNCRTTLDDLVNWPDTHFSLTFHTHATHYVSTTCRRRRVALV